MNRIAIGANKRAAPIVDTHAVLPAAAGDHEVAGARVEEETLAAHRHGPGVGSIRTVDIAARSARGNVEAIIETPLEGVEHRFARVVAAEAREDWLARAVFAEKNVRHDANEDAAVPAGDGHRRIKVSDNNRTFVIAAVRIHVVQQSNAAMLLEILVGILVVLGILDDVHATIFIEVEGDRGAQERLGGDQLDVETGPQLECLEGFGRLLRGDAGQLGGVILFLGGARQGQER